MKEKNYFLIVVSLMLFSLSSFSFAAKGNFQDERNFEQKNVIKRVTGKTGPELGSFAYEKLKEATWSYAKTLAISFLVSALYKAAVQQLEK